MSIYGEAHRALQDQFDSRRLADRLEQAMVTDRLNDTAHIAFIESRDFFFLSTVNQYGEPTVSHKGGPVGLVRVLDEKTLVFPSYDGNGMFMSMGNIVSTGKIGMLFIDFETPNRVRVQATASVSSNDPLLSDYPGAQLLVRARVDTAFVNCARYIHRHARLETSRYVPNQQGHAPLASWKRIDFVQDVLPASDVGRVATEGGLITGEDYNDKLTRRES